MVISGSMLLIQKILVRNLKKAVESSKLTGLNHIGIRSTGRCDEYEKL